MGEPTLTVLRPRSMISSMTGFPSTRRELLPSRQVAMTKAMAAAQSGGTVFLIGDGGMGRTTFALQLMNRLEERSLWIVGSRSLREVPFSLLSVFAGQIIEEPVGSTHIELIAGVGLATKKSPVRLLVDQAEYVDEQSAAVLKQLSLSGNLHLIIAATSVRTLPTELRSLLSLNSSLQIELEPLTQADAELMIRELLDGEVNASAVSSLLGFSGGHAMNLRELTLDARDAGALQLVSGYWTLEPEWTPHGMRTTELINSRLNEQPDDVRQVLETLAVTGPLGMPTARDILGAAVYDAIDGGLVRLTRGSSVSDGERGEVVQLMPMMSAQLIVSTFDSARLRRLLMSLESKLSWDLLEGQARVDFTQLRLSMGLTVRADQLLDDVLLASQYRKFAQVLALSEVAEHQSIDDPQTIEQLVLARADALYELGKPEEALALLQRRLPQGGPEIRFMAAKIAYASLGRTAVAEQILAPREGDPVSVSAYLLLIRSRANKTVNLEALRSFAQLEQLSKQGRAAIDAHVLIEQAYAGRSMESMHQYLELTQGERWEKASPIEKSELIFAFPAVALCLGVSTREMLELSSAAAIHDAFPHPGNVLSAMAISYLEAGMAREALAASEQVLGLLEISDVYLLRGFAAICAASAATLLGDRSKARSYLDLARSEPSASGQIMRPLVERGLVSVLTLVEGIEAGREEFERQLSRHREFGRKSLEMRLLLEAWQCGVVEDADELSALAAKVQGPLATALAHYAPALADPTIDTVKSVVAEHMACSHVLYAAQFAHRASEIARKMGRRTVASHLLSLSVELSAPLGSTNTCVLGRGRVERGVLTEREYDVCSLAAAGASNQQISAKLFLSTRTVEGHLQRAYTKLGITDRRQLINASSFPNPSTQDIPRMLR